jgi:predicted transcriptional regulator
LSKERVMRALKGLGISNIDTQVYVLLAKDGPHEIREIALALNQHKRDIHRSLKNLQSINIVKASIEYPLEFMAVPFEEVINLLIEIKKEKAKTLKASKEDLLSSWRSITEKGDEKS